MKHYDFSKPEDRHAFHCSREWRAMSRHVLSFRPLCEDCLAEGRAVPSRDVDHVVPLREAPNLALVESNLRALCKSCHGAKSAAENDVPRVTEKVKNAKWGEIL